MDLIYIEALPCQVAHLNFKTSRVGVYKCLSFIVGFVVTVAIWPREVISCRDFILRAVATFWAMSLVGIYPGGASMFELVLMINSREKTVSYHIQFTASPGPGDSDAIKFQFIVS